MPYQSFKQSHRLSLRGLAHDPISATWNYVLFVQTNLYDETPTAQSRTPTTLTQSKPLVRSDSWSSVDPLTTEYMIQRSFADFRKLHEAMALIMHERLPPFPTNNRFQAFFLGETPTILKKKRLALETMLLAIENDEIASQSAAYRAFLANTKSDASVFFAHSPMNWTSSTQTVEFLRYSLH